MNDYKQISARVPDEIHQALEWLMNHLEMSKAQAIRYAITEACQQHGRDVEDTMPEHGGKRPFYGIITTNQNGYGINNAQVIQGYFENHSNYNMLSYSGNFHLTDYYDTEEEADQALTDLLKQVDPLGEWE